MATDLGKVGMVMKGNYNSASTYEALDAVSYNNGLYVAKQEVPAGTAPTNTTYWQPAIDPAALNSNFIPKVRLATAGFVPTTEELSTLTLGSSTSIIETYTSDTPTLARCAILMSSVSNNYGAGILVSFYDSSWYKIKNANGTWTITAF